MQRIFITACRPIVALIAFLLAPATPVVAQTPEMQPKVQADLIASVERIVPGQPFEVALRQIIEPKWHTYWKNPGDSGEPSRISWDMPDKFTASQIAWPVPEAIPVGPLTNYGYSNEVLLPVTITPPIDLSADQVTLTANATWLVCEKICIPERATLTLTLPVVSAGEAAKPSKFAPDFDMARRSRPMPVEWPASAELGDSGLRLRIAATGLAADKIERIQFFADEWGSIDHAAPQTLKWHADGFTLALKPGELMSGSDTPKDLAGLLVLTERIGKGTARNAFQVIAPTTVVAGTSAGVDIPFGAQMGDGGGITIWHALLFAMLGGIILNAMPCVLPILSLKILSLAKHSDGDARRGGLAYLAGVMASFFVLAALLVMLKSLGASVGWGFQFQSPAFVLAMIALFFALGLSMSGVFDIGTNIVGVGEALTRRSGLSGSFSTGMLATIAATPCTAPFMGAAVGYALTRSSLETFVVLLALGLGFAAPVVALSWADAGRRILPKPGLWMETLKQALAFPLYATVVWLVWVLSLQSGSDGVLAAGIVLTGIGLAAWIIGMPTAPLRIRLGVISVIVVCIMLLLPGLLASQNNAGVSDGRNAAAIDMSGAEKFSLSAVAQHRQAGRPVFVNLTAAWCISCKVNERIALSGANFEAALAQHNIVYMKGDWTNRNDEIAHVLRSFGRAGVPLYLLYPANVAARPVVMPQILTEAIVTQHFASLSRT